MGEPIRQRRFEELPAANPAAVSALADDHPAILQSLPLFETTIVTAAESPRVLVSGHNSRKIGKVVTKGAWKGFPIYTLTLAERMTCPSSCHMWRTCYGNAMPFARRHRPGADLEEKIEAEVAELAQRHAAGFVVRLHVLGDFYAPEYVGLWFGLLAKHKALHVYGYTAAGTSAEPKFLEVSQAIEEMNDKFPDQCMIRFSSDEPAPGAAVVIDRNPESANVEEGLVCPAEREATACCATCGLCWESAARDKTIVFVQHGMGSRKSEKLATDASKVDVTGSRAIAPLPNLVKLAGKPANSPPTLLWVKPTDLHVDEAYQRSLSSRSIRLISRIVQNWNWSHVKPPICTKDEDSNTFFVIDGQHTAIAGATHPGVDKIPIMVVDADTLADRARGFISHNQDRVAVTPAQLFYSSLTAGDAAAQEIARVCCDADVTILRMPPANGRFAPGQTMALSTIKGLIRKYGADQVVSVLSCLRRADRAPVRADEAKALAVLMIDHGRAAQAEAIADMLRHLSYEDAIASARVIAASAFLSTPEALASVYATHLEKEREAA